jgi:hypothetical protein
MDFRDSYISQVCSMTSTSMVGRRSVKGESKLPRAAGHVRQGRHFREVITGTAAEVTAVSEIAAWKFIPRRITQTLMSDYTAAVQPKGKAAAA